MYDESHKDYQRETWAGFNKIIAVIALALIFLTVITLLWDGQDTTWILFKLFASVSVLLILSVGIYCAVYNVEIIG